MLFPRDWRFWYRWFGHVTSFSRSLVYFQHQIKRRNKSLAKSGWHRCTILKQDCAASFLPVWFALSKDARCQATQRTYMRFVTTHHYWTNMRCDWSRKAYIQQTYSALFRGCSTPSCAEFARGRKRDEFFLFTFHFIYLPRMTCNALWAEQQGSKTNANSCPLD